MSFDVFISYSTKDAAAAKAACAALETAKIRCWLAPRDIVVGARWGASIVRAINQCRIMVLIFSGNANASAQVYREVDRAFSQGKAVIPLRIQDIRPSDELAYYLDTVHWLDALTPPLERSLVQLVATVQAFLSTETSSVASEAAIDDAEAAQAQEEARAEDQRREGNDSKPGLSRSTHAPRPSIWSRLRPKARVPYVAALVGALALVVALAAGALLYVDWRAISTISSPTQPPPGKESSTDIIKAAANRGDSQAQNSLGIRYLLGEDGVVRDEVQALDWFRKAALQGNAKSQTNLGDIARRRAGSVAPGSSGIAAGAAIAGAKAVSTAAAGGLLRERRAWALYQRSQKRFLGQRP
jgi:TPR repeat protein